MAYESKVINFTNGEKLQAWDTYVQSVYRDLLPFKDLVGGVGSVIYKPTPSGHLNGRRFATVQVQLRDPDQYSLVVGGEDTRMKEGSVKYLSDSLNISQLESFYKCGDAQKSISQQAVPFGLAADAAEQTTAEIQEFMTCSVWSQLSGKAIKVGGIDADGFNTLAPATNKISGQATLKTFYDAEALAYKNKFNKRSGKYPWLVYVSAEDLADFRESLDKTALSIADPFYGAKQGEDFVSTDSVVGYKAGIEFRTNAYIPKGQAFFLGAQALTLQVGEGFDNYIKTGSYTANTTQTVISAFSVFGIKKTQFKGKDFGLIQINLGSSK